MKKLKCGMCDKEFKTFLNRDDHQRLYHGYRDWFRYGIILGRQKTIKEIEKFKKVPTQNGQARGYYISIPSKDWEKIKEHSK